MPVPIVIPAAPFFWIQFDQGIYTHDCHTGFYSGLQLLHLAHTWLENTSLEAVMHLTIR